MTQQRFLPDRARILSGSVLKVIATLAMLIDHAGVFLIDRNIVLLQIGGFRLTLYRLMRNTGRLAFPIFCFLLIEGFLHTRSRRRYGVSLLVLALLSEIPFDLVHNGTLFYERQNVFFTLFFGYLGICAIELFRQKPLFILLAELALAVTALFFGADYGLQGFVFILLLYSLRDLQIVRIFTVVLLNNFAFAALSFIPISLYNGKRGFIKGPVLKYLFYFIYPAHLLAIYVIKACFIGFE